MMAKFPVGLKKGDYLQARVTRENECFTADRLYRVIEKEGHLGIVCDYSALHGDESMHMLDNTLPRHTSFTVVEQTKFEASVRAYLDKELG